MSPLLYRDRRSWYRTLNSAQQRFKVVFVERDIVAMTFVKLRALTNGMHIRPAGIKL